MSYGLNMNNPYAMNWGNNILQYNGDTTTQVPVVSAGSNNNNDWVAQLGGWGNILNGANNLFNMGTSLYSAIQANNLMKDQFNWSKKLAQTNLTNQTNAFNNNLYDKYRARGLFETGNADQYMDQYNKYKATDNL